MQAIEVKQGQSFFDVVITGTGDITNAFAMALKNNVSITDELQSGNVLMLEGAKRNSITSLFNRKHYPATAVTAEQETIQEINYVFPYILPMI